MPKERDLFRKHVDDLGNRKWKCKFCGMVFAGSTPRIRAHLAGIPHHGIKACEKVADLVRTEALQTFNGKGSGLDKSTGGTSGKGTEGTAFDVSQSVLPSDNASNQVGCAQKQPSFDPPTGTGTAPACPQDQGSLPSGDRPLDNLDTTQQRENASSLPQHPMDLSASPSLDFIGLAALLEQPTVKVLGSSRSSGLQEFVGGDVLPTPLLINITTTSIPQYSNEQYLSFDEQCTDEIAPDSPLHSTDWSNHPHTLPENLESREVDVNTSEEIQTNVLHNPTVGSSSQIDSSLDVDGANRLQDCGKQREVEVVPVRGNTSPTDTVQHPRQLPPRRDKEDGNDTRRFLSRTPLDIDPSTASQHTSVVESLVSEASTNTIGSSSSHGLS